MKLLQETAENKAKKKIGIKPEYVVWVFFQTDLKSKCRELLQRAAANESDNNLQRATEEKKQPN